MSQQNNSTTQSFKKNKIKQFISKHLTVVINVDGEYNNNNLNKDDNKTTEIMKKDVQKIQYLTNSIYIGQTENDGDDVQQPQSLDNLQQLLPKSQSQPRDKQGYGVYYFSNGDVYLGKFKNDLMHNEGTYIFNSGDYFQGNFSYGKAMKGKYHYVARRSRSEPQYRQKVYIGQLKNNKPHGQGKLVFNDPNTYFQGMFQQGKQNGQGLLVTNSFTIKGQWSHGKLKKGKVTYFSKNGCSFQQTYEGEFSEKQLFQGKGKYTFSPNSYYQGQFLEGSFNGIGRLLYENGDIYQGMFQNGKKCGEGTYLSKIGNNTFKGKWYNDVLIQKR